MAAIAKSATHTPVNGIAMSGSVLKMKGVTTVRVNETKRPAHGQSTLVNFLNSLYRSNAENIAFAPAQNGWLVSSRVLQSDAARRPYNPQEIEGILQQSLPAVNLPRVVVISLGQSKRISEITSEQLAQLSGSGGLNNRGIEGMITSGVGVAQVNVGITRQLIGSYQENVTFYDNVSIYAKIIFLAMLRQSFDAHGIVPQIVAFNAANEYMHINTNVVNADFGGYNLDTVRACMSGGHIFMTNNFGWWPGNILMYRILGHAGQFFISPLNQRHIPASAYSLPGMRIASMAPAVVVMPDAADVSAAALFAFAHNLANLRKEGQALMQAYYVAAYMIGADGVVFDDCFERAVPVPPPGAAVWPDDELFALAAQQAEPPAAAAPPPEAEGADLDETQVGAPGPSGLQGTVRTPAAVNRRSTDANQELSEAGFPIPTSKNTKPEILNMMNAWRQRIIQQAGEQARLRQALAQRAALEGDDAEDEEINFYPRYTPEHACDFNGQAGHQCYILDAWYQTQLTQWPQPRDLNWMYRYVPILPL